jgi:hypothetical protein
MAVNVTVRDIVNFPGGTPKTITVDIIQIVPVAGMPEGDEIWVSSSTTAATASGGGSIESIFKNTMKRGWIRSSGLITGNIDIASNSRMVVAIDENIGSGLEITLTAGSNLLPDDIAQDIETKIQTAAQLGGGGSKIGNLSYLNAQVRFINGKFQIESGTVSDGFTATGRSSVKVGAPSTGTDVRSVLGFNITTDSETLASRQIIETDLTTAYSTGDTLTVRSTAGLDSGDAFVLTDGTNENIATISGVESASILRFTAVSGAGEGLANPYNTGALLKKLHQVDVADPVSAVTTMDALYRFQIDSIVNQIDFSA